MLKLKHIPVKSFGENIAYIYNGCALYKVDDLNKVTKLEIHKGNKTIYAFLQIVAEEGVLVADEIGLNDDAFNTLNMSEGTEVHVSLAAPSASTQALRRKISGEVLTSGEYAAIVNDISAGRYSKMDIAAFLVACSASMSSTELVSFTEALVAKKVLHWDEKKMVVDQHCLGGIPGNKTDLIILAIVAAYGLPIAKSVIKSLTSCSGVADTMGVLADVDLNATKFQKYMRENNGAIVNYDAMEETKVNHLLHDVRSQLGINQNELVIASIIAMMISSGVSHLVLDIPVGENARIRTTNEAIRIRKQVEYIGDMLGLSIDVVITDGSEPIGNGIGAVLEARDVMKVLQNTEDAPVDLKEKSLFLAGRVLEFDPQLRGGQGYAVAKEILESGRALETFKKIVNSQGVKQVPNLGQYVREVVAPYDGVISAINNITINKIGVYAGATQCIGSGLDLKKKTGDRVKAGEVLYVIYSCNAADFDVVSQLVEVDSGYSISI